MSKRRAGAELTHDNWDQEDEPEEAGKFLVADQATLSKRPMMKARRRYTGQQKEEEAPVATKAAFTGFKGFTGFGGSSLGSTNTAASFSFKPLSSTKSSESQETSKPQTTSIFGSLKSSQESKPAVTFSESIDSKPSSAMFKIGKVTSEGVTLSSNGSTTVAPNRKGDGEKASDAYANELRSLNQSVSAWIQKHVETNPICDLSPIFDDYRKHLAEIEKKRSEGKEEESVAESKTKPQLATVSPLSSTQDKSSSNNAASFTGFRFSSTPASTSTASSGSNSSTNSGFSLGSGSSSDNKGFSFGATKASTITANTAAPASMFSFGTTKADPSSTSTTTTPASMFSFGSTKPAAQAEDGEKKNAEEGESDDPPKVEVKIVEEEGAVHSTRCKVFYKQGAEFKDRGVGMLHLKKAGNSAQVIVRADTSLGTIALNIGLSEDQVQQITKQGKNKNNLMLMSPLNPPVGKKCPKCDKPYKSPQESTDCGNGCTPDPVALLLRVKKEADADELLAEMKKLFE